MNAGKRAQAQKIHGHLLRGRQVAKNLADTFSAERSSVLAVSSEAAADGACLLSGRVSGVIANHQVIGLVDTAQNIPRAA